MANDIVSKDIENFMELYPEELRQVILKKGDVLNKISKQMTNFVPQATKGCIAMICNSKTCPHKASCILLKNNIHPEGYSCPIEAKIMNDMQAELMISLKIKDNDFIEMELLMDLIDLKIIDLRASGIMSDGQLLQTLTTKNFDGTETSQDVSNGIVSMKINLKKLKHSIMDSFIATRRARKRYGLGDDKRSIKDILLNLEKVENESDEAF